MTTTPLPRVAPLPFLAHSAAAVIVAAATILAGVALAPDRAGAQEPTAAAAAALPTKNLIDTGESYGSPAAVQATEKLHAEMVKRGYAAKPALLGRSRGGLWASAWAIAHPDLTAGLGGIYPVYDWRTYPGAESAAGAYGLSPADLRAKIKELCPVERIDVAARAGIPVCIIHGDIDAVVPIEPNSGRVKARYEALGKGDLVELIVAEGQGHNFWEGFFHCQKLVDFLIEKARAGATGSGAPTSGK